MSTLAAFLLAIAYWTVLVVLAGVALGLVLAAVAIMWMIHDWWHDRGSFPVAARVHAHLNADDELERMWRLPARTR